MILFLKIKSSSEQDVAGHRDQFLAQEEVHVKGGYREGSFSSIKSRTRRFCQDQCKCLGQGTSWLRKEWSLFQIIFAFRKQVRRGRSAYRVAKICPQGSLGPLDRKLYLFCILVNQVHSFGSGVCNGVPTTFEQTPHNRSELNTELGFQSNCSLRPCCTIRKPVAVPHGLRREPIALLNHEPKGSNNY